MFHVPGAVPKRRSIGGCCYRYGFSSSNVRQANGCYDREITLRGRVHEIGGVKEKLSRHIGGNKDDRQQK